ncbi:hypothetical protein CVT24_003047 [Panaeolus cyanescens]|uniref:Uncharacterized protein n=1 Tax=Panaeolus cyanescens TaxID=181874 RepID=A0A409YXU7_9AGAR|nr:hypothetical protein CVT24_003047 [Panaeolus cyanescens]
MRGAANGDGLVNMQGNDARLSDFLVKRIVHSIRQGKRVSTPKNLVFIRRA